MSANSESVVIELQAKLDAFNAAVKRGEVQFDQSMVHIGTSAGRAEKAISDALGNNLEKPFMSASTRTRQLGVQIGQLGSSLGSGISPMSALAQQASDFAYVLNGTGGAAGKLATFFSGPWGAALLAAGLVVGTLATKLHLTTDEVGDQVDKLKQHAHQTGISEQAARLFAGSLDGVLESARDTKKALDELNSSDKSQSRIAFEAAYASLERARALRTETQALLDRAQAQYYSDEASARSPQERDIAAARMGANASRIAELRTELATTDATIATQETRLNQLQARMVADRVSLLADPVQKIHTLADEAVKAAARQAANEGLVGDELTRQVGIRTKIIRLQEEADVKAEQAKHRAAGTLGSQQVSSFIMPVEGPITSGFGPRTPPTRGASSFHPAIDIAAPTGTPVKAAAGGVVITSGRLGGLGNVVIVDHGGGTISEYGHLSATLAKVGQRVDQGDVIGRVGSTGISTGSHLDFRVRVGGRYVDPRSGGGRFPVDELAAGTKAQQLAEQAAREAQAAAARETAYQNELEALEGKLLGQQRTKLLSTDEQLALNEKMVIHDRDAANSSYEGAVKAGRLDRAQADILIAKNNELATARTMRLYQDEGLRKAQVAAALDEQTRQANIEQLQSDVRLAKTGEERRNAMLALLDAEIELTRIKQQQIVDSTAVGSAEHELAQLKLNQLDAERNRRTAEINRDPSAMSPGQAYLQSITKTGAQLGEDFESVTVRGLERMNDQLAEATLKFFGLGNASHTVLGQVVSDLARIAIQQAIVKPIAQLLFGGSSGGGGGLFGALLSGIGLVSKGGSGGGIVPGFNIGGGTSSYFASNPFGGFRAGGGRVQAGRTYWVGERGPEPFVPDQSGMIIPNSSLMSGGGGRSVVEVHVVSDDEKFGAFITNITDPRIARGSIQAARGGAMLARQSLMRQAMHQLD